MKKPEKSKEELLRENDLLKAKISKLEKSKKEITSSEMFQKVAAEKIIQQNNFLLSLLDSMSYPFYVIDANDYTIVLGNPASGFDATDKKTTCHDLTHNCAEPCSGIKHLCPLKIVKKTKKSTIVEHLHYDKTGKVRNVEVHCYPIFDDEGNVIQVIEYSLDITERKQAEEVLRENEHHYRELVEKSGIAILIDDRKGNFTYFNHRFSEFFGYTKAEMKEKSIETLVHPEDVDRILDIHTKRMKGRKSPSRYEFRGVRKDGSTIHLEVDIVDLKKGKIYVGTRSYLWDITERKQAEEKSHLIEANLKHTFDISPGLICIADANTGYFLECNPAVISMLGFSIEEFTSRPSMEFIHPHDRQRTTDEITKQLKGRAVANFENRYLCKDESYKWLAWQATAADKTGKVYAVATDITEHKQTEKKMQESEEKYRILFQTMVQGVTYQNLEGHIISANPSAERILGLTLAQMMGGTSIDPRWKSIHEDGSDFPGDTHPSMIALKTGKEIQNVRMGVFHPGANEYIWIDINAVPQFRSGETKPYQVYTTFTDITEYKQAEEELNKTHQDLLNFSIYTDTKIEEEKKKIAREIHDGLGQLLSALKINLVLIGKSFTKEKEIIKKFNEMRNMLDASLQIVHNTTKELRPVILDDLGIISALQSRFSDLKVSSGIEIDFIWQPIHFTLEPDLSLTVYRVFMEIITNIMLHAKTRKVTIKFRKNKTCLSLIIRDYGVGITVDQITSSLSFGLIGIRERLNIWQGKMSIDGVPGKGTTIKIRIPYPSS
jgi:PAS domain S-box-containing protein